MATYEERHRGQVAHIAEHLAAFKDHAGDVDISEYLLDYAGRRHNIYQRLCADLGIEPQPALFHPDPYGETLPTKTEGPNQ